MKTVGIIGGLGPETTAEFYREIIVSCEKKNKTSRPPMLIWNVPITYAIEQDAIARARGEERAVPLLIDAAQRLERGGADFLVMPCNTFHVFIDEIRRVVKIPVISIVEETVAFLKKKRVSDVGILATTLTLQRNVYEKQLGAHGIRQIAPDGLHQAKIGRIVHHLVSNRPDNKDRKDLSAIVDRFAAKGITTVILACTDLQLLIPDHRKVKIYDTMQILADATVERILKK